MSQIKTSPEKTMLTLTVGFLALFGYTQNHLFFWMAFILGGIGIFVPFLAKGIDLVWMKLALILGMIFPKIMLTLLFYLILFPIATLSKIFSKNRPLVLENPSKSTFTEVNQKFSPHFFEKIW